MSIESKSIKSNGSVMWSILEPYGLSGEKVWT